MSSSTTQHILLLGAANAGKSTVKDFVHTYFAQPCTPGFQCHIRGDETDTYQGPYTAAWALVDYAEPDMYNFITNTHLAMNQLLTADAPRRLLVFTKGDLSIPKSKEKQQFIRYALREIYTHAGYDEGGYHPIYISAFSQYNMYRVLGMSLPPYSSPIDWFDYVKFKGVASHPVTA